jgi:hypothetical protein
VKTLNVPISEKTRRKLGALAILTGQKFDSIESEVSSMLDRILSSRIDEALAHIDGREMPEYEEPAPVFSKTSAPVEQVEEDDENEEANPVDDLAGHELSGDEDEGAPSLEDQVNDDPNIPKIVEALPDKPRPPQAKVRVADDLAVPDLTTPDVGGNSEAFLDSALGLDDEKPVNAVSRYSRGRPVERSFNPKKRTARVAEYTGDGDEVDFL